MTLLLTLTRSRMTTLQEDQEEEEEDHKDKDLVSSQVRVSSFESLSRGIIFTIFI